MKVHQAKLEIVHFYIMYIFFNKVYIFIIYIYNYN